jgi:hypothetical protein
MFNSILPKLVMKLRKKSIYVVILDLVDVS